MKLHIIIKYFCSVGLLDEDSWPPAFEFYDFLKIMDMQEPDSAQQQTPKEEEEEVNVKEHVVVEDMTGDNRHAHSELWTSDGKNTADLICLFLCLSFLFY